MINSLTQIQQDMDLNGENLPYGMPSNFNWYSHGRIGMGLNYGTSSKAIFPWFVVFPTGGVSQATNTRFQVRNIHIYYLSKSTNTWVHAVGSNTVGGFYNDYTTNINYNNITVDRRTETATNGGGSSIKLLSGYAYQGWAATTSPTLSPIPMSDIAATWSYVEGRLIVDNPSLPDDRASANLILSAGGDYKDLNYNTIGDICIGRFKNLTNDWRAFNSCTLTDAQWATAPLPPVDAFDSPSYYSQTITFGSFGSVNVGTHDFSAGAIASSGLPVSYSSSNTGVATIVNGLIHITGAGSTVITASQAGNSSYSAATNVSHTLVVSKLNQSITFQSIPSKTYGDADFAPSASASSGIAVSYTSDNLSVATIVNNQVHIVGAGSANITASQSGNASYNSATSVSVPLVVNKASRTVSFAPISQVAYGSADVALPVISGVTYSSGNTGVVTVTGNSLHIVSAGTSVITATLAGDNNYQAATATQTMQVNKLDQTLTFTLPTAVYAGSSSIVLPANSNAGLTIAYTSDNTAVASIQGGNNLVIVGVGIANITATQAGNNNYNPAATFTQLLSVKSGNVSGGGGSGSGLPTVKILKRIIMVAR